MGVIKIKKKKRLENRDIYAVISIIVFILVISFALNAVHSTEAALNGINSPSGMASLSVNKTNENIVINESIEPILVKNGLIWQLRKLRFK